MKITHTFNLDEQTVKKLRKKSKETGLTLSALATLAIRKSMKENRTFDEKKQKKEVLSLNLYLDEAQYLKSSKSASKFLNEILKEGL